MILVTGSSGVVGQELLKELTGMGVRVRAGYHTRPPSLPQVDAVRIDVTTGGHAGRAGGLCGPEALTHAEAASKLLSATGSPINCVDLPEADLKQGLMEAGAPEWFADALVDLYRYYTTGQAGGLTTAIKDVTGRNPIAFDQFAHDYAALWTV